MDRQNLIKPKQLHLPLLSGFITGVTYPTITGASGVLRNLVNELSGYLYTGTSRTYPITNGVDFILCPFGAAYSGRPTFVIGNSGGLSAPLLIGNVTNYTTTGIRVDLSDQTRTTGYYITVDF